MRHLAAIVLSLLALAMTGCVPTKRLEPEWRWSEPYVSPTPIACGAGGKACR